jgi:hypothetical protein
VLWPSAGDEQVEPGCDSFTTHFKELFVGGGVEQLWIKRYLLDAESLFAALCCKKGKVLFWWLVADDTVGLATNEGQVGYIVGLSRKHSLASFFVVSSAHAVLDIIVNDEINFRVTKTKKMTNF